MSLIFFFFPGIVSRKGPPTAPSGTLDSLSMINLEFNLKSSATHVLLVFLMLLMTFFSSSLTYPLLTILPLPPATILPLPDAIAT